MKWIIPICSFLVAVQPGSAAFAQEAFTNLDFESATYPYPMQAGASVPASDVLPGWTASPDSTYIESSWTRGPWIGVELATGWAGAQGNYYVGMKPGSGPFAGYPSIAQTGYLSPTIRSLRFTVWANLTDFVVSFAGQNLSCTVVSSSPFVAHCAADVSRFAGTTGELKFVAYGMISLDEISFSSEPVLQPPTGTILSISRTVDSGVQVTFSAQVGTWYSFQTTTDLSNWQTVETIWTTNAIVEFSDSSASNSPTRFYRVMGPP